MRPTFLTFRKRLNFITLVLLSANYLQFIGAERRRNLSNSVVNRGYTVDDCTCVCGKSKDETGAIVGGVETKPGEFPWIVALMLNSNLFYCAGVLITRYHILTAAHCLKEAPEPSDITVILGEYDRSNPMETATEIRSVVSADAHDEFDEPSFDNDIAILKLDSSVDFTPNILPACLPKEDDNKDYVGRIAITAGWGQVGANEASSNILLKVELPVVSLKECKEALEGLGITENMLCTGFPEGKKDACNGDSGGPLHLDGEIIGIVSWGIGCGEANTPGVFTKVNNYISWIKEHIDDECLCPPSKRGNGKAEIIFT
ncbi:trypsin-like [Periplaneta americana]|uniref:trypsin-like n=1 Tax=Periplaneta americana TaxID=6978 RepID=UPI0037E87A4E